MKKVFDITTFANNISPKDLLSLVVYFMVENDVADLDKFQGLTKEELLKDFASPMHEGLFEISEENLFDEFFVDENKFNRLKNSTEIFLTINKALLLETVLRGYTGKGIEIALKEHLKDVKEYLDMPENLMIKIGYESGVFSDDIAGDVWSVLAHEQAHDLYFSYKEQFGEAEVWGRGA